MPFRNEILDLLSGCCTGLGIAPPDSVSFLGMCVIHHPLISSPNRRKRVQSCKVVFAKSNLNGLEGWQPFPVNGFVKDLVPSWHSSLLRGAARNKSKFLYMSGRASLPSALQCFMPNAIGCAMLRFGRPGYNLVTSTSGLKTKQMWDDAWLKHTYYYYWLSTWHFGWWNGAVTAFLRSCWRTLSSLPSQTLDSDCLWSWTFPSQPVLSSLYTAITSTTGRADSSPAVPRHNIEAICEPGACQTQLLRARGSSTAFGFLLLVWICVKGSRWRWPRKQQDAHRRLSGRPLARPHSKVNG